VGNITVEKRHNGEKRFEAIFKSAAVGIILIDDEGKFFEVNDAFCEMVKYSCDELYGTNCNDISYSEDKRLHIEFFQNLSKGDLENYYLEKRFVAKDGEVIWARVTFSAIREKNGDFLYSIGVVENITPQKQAEYELETVLSDIILNWDIDDAEREVDRERLKVMTSNMQM
jgi:PAS domain S-box-containing protein